MKRIIRRFKKDAQLPEASSSLFLTSKEEDDGA